MSKKKKVEPASKTDDQDDRQYKPKYLKNVLWLPEFDGSHIVTINGDRFKSYKLFYLVLESASDAWHKHQCKTPLNSGWGTDLAKRRFMRYCEYELTSVFAQVWLDKWIENLCPAMYTRKYAKVLASLTTDTNTYASGFSKADREADRAASAYVQDFLNPLSVEAPLKCLDLTKLSQSFLSPMSDS